MFRTLVGRGGLSSLLAMTVAWAILVAALVEVARAASLLFG
jgi:hypothetical protein